jgi:hypothetical protein
MQWDSVQTTARDAGYLVYAMDQAQTAPMTQPGPWGAAYDGYCQGMAVRWIALRLAGSDFPFDAGTQVYEATDWKATAIQTIYQNQDKSGELEHWQKATHAHYLSVSDGLQLSRNNRASGAFVNLLMTRSTGCYGISLKGQGVGHAIAAQNEDGKTFRLFDANYGHFSAPSADIFKQFLDWYFEATGYDQRFSRQTFICEVHAAR